jgi:hypothetical protein
MYSRHMDFNRDNEASRSLFNNFFKIEDFVTDELRELLDKCKILGGYDFGQYEIDKINKILTHSFVSQFLESPHDKLDAADRERYILELMEQHALTIDFYSALRAAILRETI